LLVTTCEKAVRIILILRHIRKFENIVWMGSWCIVYCVLDWIVRHVCVPRLEK